MHFFYNGDSEKSGIYLIWNRHKDRAYIGQTSRLFNKRWSEHRSALLRRTQRARGTTNVYLKHDFWVCYDILGNDNFLEFHILESMDNPTEKHLNDREKFWVSEHKKNGVNLYNLNDGGGHCAAAGMSGKHHTEIAKQKIGNANRGRPRPDVKGKSRTEEVKQKIRATLMGHPVAEVTKQKIRKARAHQIFSEETRQKFRERMMGNQRWKLFEEVTPELAERDLQRDQTRLKSFLKFNGNFDPKHGLTSR